MLIELIMLCYILYFDIRHIYFFDAEMLLLFLSFCELAKGSLVEKLPIYE